MKFKRVPAIDKCFQILELFGQKKEPMGITEISKELELNKSTVFNMVYMLTDLGILDHDDNKFHFGTKLYILGKSAKQGSDLIRNIHPYLKQISKKTNLCSFLGMRSGLEAIIIDKSDSSYDLKVSSEIGTKIPLVAGAHGRAFLSLLPDEEINVILSDQKSKRYLHLSDKAKREEYWGSVMKVKKEGFAYENEEYLEGIRALAIPLKLNKKKIHCVIWAIGLKNQIKKTSLKAYIDFLKEVANKIESRF